MLHPAEWAKMSEEERRIAAIQGDVESGIHWKVVRVAGIFGIDPEVLEQDVEIERGWEPHDKGYLHQIVHGANRIRRKNNWRSVAVIRRTE